MENISVFFAYPSQPIQVKQTIRTAVALANESDVCSITTWEENDIAGRPLTAPIFNGLKESDFLLADITKLNFNVTFELGYAIGLGKRTFLTRSNEFATDSELVGRIGIFDTLGYRSYDDSKSLSQLITNIDDLHPINTSTERNRSSPAYILETPIRGEIMSHIISKVKKLRYAIEVSYQQRKYVFPHSMQ